MRLGSGFLFSTWQSAEMAVQVRTGHLLAVDTIPVRTRDVNREAVTFHLWGSRLLFGRTADGDPKERRCTMNPGLVLALMMLLLVLIPLLFTLFLLTVQAITVVALSHTDEERKAALVSVLVGALKRR